MSPATYVWVHIAHILGFTAWVAGLVAVAALLRAHTGADAASKPGIVNAARSIALLMDIGGTIAIGIGLFLAFRSPMFGGRTAFSTGGWLHVKLLLVVLGLLVPHILMRIQIGKLRREVRTSGLPAWILPLVLVAAAAIIVLGSHPTLMRS